MKKAITAGLIKTLFCVTLLVSLILYPPTSAHAHANAHGVVTVENTDTEHMGGHGAHAHHAMGDVQVDLTDSDTSSDTPNCCQGICMTAMIAQSQKALPRVNGTDHAVTWLSSFSPFDPVAHRKPPKHLI